MKNLIISTLAVGVLALGISQAVSSTFWEGHVINVAADDHLNIRKWPASYSRIIDALPVAASVSMTGRCKKTTTNHSFRIDGGQPTGWKFAKMEQPYVWCQVVSTVGEVGWVRGSYVWPQ